MGKSKFQELLDAKVAEYLAKSNVPNAKNDPKAVGEACVLAMIDILNELGLNNPKNLFEAKKMVGFKTAKQKEGISLIEDTIKELTKLLDDLNDSISIKQNNS